MYKTIIVTDEDLGLNDPSLSIIDFETYLREYPKLNEPKTRLINLCQIDVYLSQGYYCSLLAEARKHKVLPSVKTINSLRLASPGLLYQYLSVKDITVSTASFIICFGQTEDKQNARLAQRIFERFPAPLLQVNIETVDGLPTVSVERTSLSSLTDHEKAMFTDSLKQFTTTVWRNHYGRKAARWEMAILVNPDESDPPSNKEAITRFIRAAKKQGIHAETVTHDSLKNVANYDALFIRETTAIDHHTYRIAESAENAGLVVIDDSQSILRCCNKVYMHDAFSYQGVPCPATRIIYNQSSDTLASLETQFGYPMILKMPEGSFSRGVYKVQSREQLVEKLALMFSQSALVLVQEYMFTDFDWRIGILNNRAIYACKYQMVRNHWQIYNHGHKKSVSGGFATLPTFEVPKLVLQAALKAARTIGNGLYGVDVKELEGKAYVLEVNDNPSIEHKVEDLYLGDELYMQIIAEFQRRLEERGR